MILEVCNLCYKPFCDLTKTEVIIKDYKGFTIDYCGVFPARRRFKAVICDDCLSRLRTKTKEE
jgi:hypothetical protein